jgi:hypothetical protein
LAPGADGPALSISPVGAITDRPWILHTQNPSPQGESQVIFFRKIRKTLFFDGRAMLAPTFTAKKMPPKGGIFLSHESQNQHVQGVENVGAVLQCLAAPALFAVVQGDGQEGQDG